MKKIFLLLLFSNFIFSQSREATIFFTDDTSVKGYGEIKNNIILFKTELKDAADEWDFEVIKGITFSGYGFSERIEYVKVKKDSNPILLEVIEEGLVNLYKDTKLTTNMLINPFSDVGLKNQLTNENPFGNSLEEKYFVKRNEEDFATSISFNFKNKALKYFSDCAILVEKIKSKKFTNKNIEEVVFYYNDFCGKDQDEQ